MFQFYRAADVHLQYMYTHCSKRCVCPYTAYNASVMCFLLLPCSFLACLLLRILNIVLSLH